MELNSQPDRLDLDDIYCKMARDMGVMVAISSDAHSIDELNFMRYGITQGRRGWLEPADVLNTRSWKDLKKIMNMSQKGQSILRNRNAQVRVR
jgi:DNA polymerase (family 10)